MVEMTGSESIRYLQFSRSRRLDIFIFEVGVLKKSLALTLAVVFKHSHLNYAVTFSYVATL